MPLLPILQPSLRVVPQTHSHTAVATGTCWETLSVGGLIATWPEVIIITKNGYLDDQPSYTIYKWLNNPPGYIHQVTSCVSPCWLLLVITEIMRNQRCERFLDLTQVGARQLHLVACILPLCLTAKMCLAVVALPTVHSVL